MRDTYDDVTIALITCNEEKAIGQIVEEILVTLPGADVVVVDDSTDNTKEVATAAGAQVFDGPRQGFGPAMFQALTISERPIIGTIDADGTYPVSVFPRLIELVRSEYDIAGTDRLRPKRPQSMPKSNWFANRLFSLIASVRSRTKICDVHSDQRIYRREVLHSFDWNYRMDALPIDLVFVPVYHNRKIIELPIDYSERIGETTLVRWSSGRASLKRLFCSRQRLKTYVKINN